MVSEVNKEIHDQRMRRYFIESAKDLIRGEGIQAVNVRVVAELAGYSYATMYKYFKDVQSLIFACVEDFILEIGEFINKKRYNKLDDVESIKAKSIEYSNYFVQYPGIFHLIFCEKIVLLNNQKLVAEKSLEFWNSIFSESFNSLKDLDNYASRINIIKDLHFSAIHGRLIFYLNRKEPKEYKTFLSSLKNDLDFIFNI